MTRILSPWAAGAGQARLEALAQATSQPDRYKAAMYGLGVELGRHLAHQLEPGGHVCVVCTVEDADFLGRGVIEEFEGAVGKDRVHLVCFWNRREKLPGPHQTTSVAPIIRRYVEPTPDGVAALVVLKSIIAGGCTVRTNVQELVHSLKPKRVLVAAPVVLRGSLERVKEGFPPALAERFEFAYLAEDSERDPDTGNVLPGVGGNVYSLLGFVDQDDKNRHYPDLVMERQTALGG